MKLFNKIFIFLLCYCNQQVFSQTVDILTQPNNSSICSGDNASFKITAQNAISFQWQINNGGGFIDISNNLHFSGANSAELIILNTDITMKNNLFRCEVNGAIDKDTSTQAVLSISEILHPNLLINPFCKISSVNFSFLMRNICKDSIEIYYRPINQLTWITTFSILDSFQLHFLINDTSYEWKARTVYKGLTSEFTPLSTFNTLPCLPPDSILVSDIDDHSAFIEWEDKSDGYSFFIRPENSFKWDSTNLSTNSTYLNPLIKSSKYYISITSQCGILNRSGHSDSISIKTDSLNDVNDYHSLWNPDSTGYKYLYRGGNINRWTSTSGTITLDNSKIRNGKGSLKWVVPAGSGIAWLDLNVEDINLLNTNVYSFCSTDTMMQTTNLYIKSKQNVVNYLIDKIYGATTNGNYLPAFEWSQRGGSAMLNLPALSPQNTEDLKHISSIRIKAILSNVPQIIWVNEIKYIQPKGPAAIIHLNHFRNSQDSLLVPWLLEKKYPVNIDFTYIFANDTQSELRGNMPVIYRSLPRIKHLLDSTTNWSTTHHGTYYEFLTTIPFEERMKVYSTKLFKDYGIKKNTWCFSIPTDIVNPKIKKEMNDLNRFNSFRSQTYMKPNSLPLDNPQNVSFFRPTSSSAFIGQQKGIGNPKTLDQMKAVIDEVKKIKGLLIFDLGSILIQPSATILGGEFTMLDNAKDIIKYADSLGLTFINFQDLFYDPLYKQGISINNDYYDYKLNSTDTLTVLNNDLHPSNKGLTIVAAGNPIYGKAIISADKKNIIYKSAYAKTTDKFWYSATDGNLVDTAWVFVSSSCYDSLFNMPNKQICVGQNLFLVPDSVMNIKVKWTGPQGFATQQKFPVLTSINLKNAGKYFLTTNLPGCPSYKDSLYVEVKDSVTIWPGKSYISACNHDTVKIEIKADFAKNYYWQVNTGTDYKNIIVEGKQYSGIYTPQLIINGVSKYMNQFLYRCIIGGFCTTDDTTYATRLIVNDIPPAPTGVSSQNVCGAGTIENLIVAGNAISWYTTSNSIDSIKIKDSIKVTNFYFAKQTINGCLSDSSKKIKAVILPIKTYYADLDHDGKGSTSNFKNACSLPANFVTNNLDCNDNDSTVYTGAIELLDQKDNDCNGKTDEVYTKLKTVDCGITLNNLNDPLSCNSVSGATNYKYLISDGKNIYTYIKGSNSLGFSMSNVSGVVCNKTYNVTVSAFIVNKWYPYGEICKTTTPLTYLKNYLCNTTLSTVYQSLEIYPQNDATNYKYEAFDGTNTLTYIKGNSATKFNMLNFPGFSCDKTYQIRVSALSGGVWQPWGKYCSISVPSTQVKFIYCDSTLKTLDQILQIYPQPEATNFKFEAFDGVNTLNYTKGFYGLSFKMTDFIGSKNNTVYQVRISAYVNGVWQTWGNYCTIRTPQLKSLQEPSMLSEMLLPDTEQENNPESMQLEVYPNPNDGDFTIYAFSNGVCSIYNELGQLVQTFNIEGSTNFQVKVKGLNKGFYIVNWVADNQVAIRKIIVN